MSLCLEIKIQDCLLPRTSRLAVHVSTDLEGGRKVFSTRTSHDDLDVLAQSCLAICP